MRELALLARRLARANAAIEQTVERVVSGRCGALPPACSDSRRKPIRATGGNCASPPRPRIDGHGHEGRRTPQVETLAEALALPKREPTIKSATLAGAVVRLDHRCCPQCPRHRRKSSRSACEGALKIWQNLPRAAPFLVSKGYRSLFLTFPAKLLGLNSEVRLKLGLSRERQAMNANLRNFASGDHCLVGCWRLFSLIPEPNSARGVQRHYLLAAPRRRRSGAGAGRGHPGPRHHRHLNDGKAFPDLRAGPIRAWCNVCTEKGSRSLRSHPATTCRGSYRFWSLAAVPGTDGVWISFAPNAGSGGKALGFGKSRAKLLDRGARARYLRGRRRR